MPHVNIKFYPVELSDIQKRDLVAAVTDAICNAFNCDENVISIALEPIEPEMWNQQVHIPELEKRAHLLCKVPNYP